MLQTAGRTATAGLSRRVLGRALPIAETAISLVLIVGAALLVKSFVLLVDVNAGFRTDHLLTFQLPLPTAKFLVEGADQPDRVRQALIGLYSVIAHLVAQSTREIGLRVALGASRGGVLRLVLRQGLGPACIGLVVGTLLSVLITPGIRSLLYGVEPLDPRLLIAVPCALALACLVACVVPARRALQVDPVVALRAE